MAILLGCSLSQFQVQYAVEPPSYGTKVFVHFSEASLFQGNNDTYWYSAGTCLSILAISILEVSLRGSTVYVIVKFSFFGSIVKLMLTFSFMVLQV